MENHITVDEFYLVATLTLAFIWILGYLIFGEFDKIHDKLK